MAQASFNFPFQGTLGGVSFYTTKRGNKLIARLKGGPTAEQIKTLPQFKPVRDNMQEFAACSKAAGRLNQATYGLKPLSNYNITAAFVKKCSQILKLDTEHLRGQRSLLFSRFGKLLEGFNVNNTKSFEQIIMYEPSFTIDKPAYRATIYFTEMYPGINFDSPFNYPFFRLIGVLGVLPDMIYTTDGHQPVNRKVQSNPVMTKTDWNNCDEVYPGDHIELQLPEGTIVDDSISLVLSVGIEFGYYKGGGKIGEGSVGRARKILAVR